MSILPKQIDFLSLAEIIQIHADQIRRYGGRGGIIDMARLSSASAMPYASFHGEFLHKDIFEMAAAYAYHISGDHPFVDGNKRTALVSALVFLEINDIRIADPRGAMYEAMMSMARGDMGKDGFAKILRSLCSKPR